MDDLSVMLREKTETEIIDYILHSTDFDLKRLILPLYDKSLYDKSVRIICKLDDQKIISMLPDLLEWFEDMNWPGTTLLAERLNAIPRKNIEPYLQIALKKASDKSDEIWYYWLRYIFYPETIDENYELI